MINLTTVEKWLLFGWIDMTLLLVVFVMFGIVHPGNGFISQVNQIT